MSDGMSEAFGSARRKEREAEAKKYIVFYVLRATPKLKKFETLKEAKKFGEKINNIDGQKDSWVDAIVKGKVLCSPGYSR